MERLTASKATTQRAALERYLARWRTKMILPYIRNQKVLDFGCGENLWTMTMIRPYVKDIVGFDIRWGSVTMQTRDDGLRYCGNLDQVDIAVDRVVSLACFEHIEPDDLPDILRNIARIATHEAKIVGTVPRPPAKPVLEFLSYRLGLIDESQIRDHRVYYDRSCLDHVVSRGGWTVEEYRNFQFGMNSFFVLGRTE